MQIEKPPLSELYLRHYGVKGMKWGVRKETKLSRAIRKDKVLRSEKKAAKVNIRKVTKPVIDIRMKEMFEPGMSEKTYKSLSTQKVVIQKGEEFARITKRSNEVLRDKTYVAYRPDDRETYRAIMPINNPMTKRKPDYEYVYAATKKLSGPSEKERVDMFIEMMDKPSLEYGGKTMSGREFLTKAGLGKQIKDLDTQQLGLREYQRQMAFGLMMDTPIGKAYVSETRKRGYDILTDDNDRKVLSNDPLILLNPSGSVKKMSVRRLSKREVNKAQQNFKAAEASRGGG